MIRELVEDLDNNIKKLDNNISQDKLKTKKVNYKKLIQKLNLCTDKLDNLSQQLDTITEYHCEYMPTDNTFEDNTDLNDKLEEIKNLTKTFNNLLDIEEKISMYGEISKSIALCTRYINSYNMSIENI